MIVIVDIFREICRRVQMELAETTEIKSVNYIFGDSSYINKILEKMSKSGFYEKLKFPLIGLYHPFEESEGESKEYSTRVPLSFILATNTISDYDNEKRMEESFIPVLYPLYKSFINQVSRYEGFEIDDVDLLRRRKIDEFRFGSRNAKDSSGEEFPLIDCIKIKDLELKIKNEKCDGKRIFY